MTDTEHPNAEDYRNRAERAEQALAEMAGWDGLSLAVALTQCQAKLAAAEADADRLAEALDATRDEMLSIAHSEFDGVWRQPDFDEIEAPAVAALAAHAARKIDG